MSDDITTHPIVAWTMGTLPRGCVLLNLGALQEAPERWHVEEVKKLTGFLNFSMTAAQADELASELRKYAELSRARQIDDKSKN